MTSEEWTLAVTVYFSGLAAGLFGMLCTILRPMLQAKDGRDFRNFMGAFLRFADHSLGKVYNLAWSLVMGIGPIVALVLLWDDPGSPRSSSPRLAWGSCSSVSGSCPTCGRPRPTT
jgi:hypothetical protein